MLLWASICTALISGLGLVHFGSLHWASDLAAIMLALSMFVLVCATEPTESAFRPSPPGQVKGGTLRTRPIGYAVTCAGRPPLRRPLVSAADAERAESITPFHHSGHGVIGRRA
jgi:hypothetical protein